MAITPVIKPYRDDDNGNEVEEFDFTLPRDDADVVLVSGDKPASEAKAFYVHRMVLAAASPFFRDLFGLPQPKSIACSCDGTMTDGKAVDSDLPRIRLTESHVILSLLLRLVYPLPKPHLSRSTLPVPMLSDLLGAATKYVMSFPLSYLWSVTMAPGAGYLEEDATRVYAIACRFEMENEAKEAMRWAMRKGVDVASMPLEDEWRWVSAWEYKRLEGWVGERREEVIKVIQGWYKATAEADVVLFDEEVAQGEGLPKCMQCNGSPFTSKEEPKWWTEFVRRVSEREKPGMWLGTGRMFEMDFLAEVVRDAGCPRCAGSVLSASRFLGALRCAVAAVVDA
ncbi:hypothetical protein AX15_007417 [Amanita polypyramis BW_CC]|nr:hypothetical protein AX15_007417 [Amanita polypyramis BW_CC]